MSSPVLDHAYAYRTSSTCTPTNDGFSLRLSTSGGIEANPRLFSGVLPEAAIHATALLVVGHCARSRFFNQSWPLYADPVITCHADRLRFESLSSCGSAYVRHDADLSAADGEVLRPGVSNVDLSPDTRAVLGQIVSRGGLQLDIGTDGLEVSTEGASSLERRVPIPVRWVKGFADVALAVRALPSTLTLDGPQALGFLRTLPKQGKSLFLVPGFREPRWSSVAAPGAIRVGDPGRLALLGPLFRHATSLVVRGGDTGVSSWQIDAPGGRTHLVLSPTSSRGFSGEGRVLDPLASERLGGVADDVSLELAWQPTLDAASLARRIDGNVGEVDDALGVLAARGQAGFDAATGAYFHRDLPYDLTKVEALQPRLTAARKLVSEGAVRLVDGDAVAWVTTATTEHRVRLQEDPPACTCAWWGRHRGARGPCKHVLAATLATNGAPQ